MRQPLENPFYYLDNFERVLAWVGQHHGDLLDEDERAFLDAFPQLPRPSRALLVRMVMRKGELFRASKLRYAEIGCALQASEPLVARGWIDPAPALALEQLFALLKKDELLQVFDSAAAGLRKTELLDCLRASHASAQT